MEKVEFEFERYFPSSVDERAPLPLENRVRIRTRSAAPSEL